MELSSYYLEYIVNEIHTVVLATVNEKNEPVTCAVDMMDQDGNSLYFLTATGKSLYERLKRNNMIAFTGLNGSNTMHSVAVSVKGKAKEVGTDRLAELFEKNPYMKEIYPDEITRKALTVFQICDGNGEWFDLSKKPIERKTFVFGNAEEIVKGYRIADGCIGCGACLNVCPQKCIDSTEIPFKINQENCLYCGNCYSNCPADAITKL